MDNKYNEYNEYKDYSNAGNFTTREIENVYSQCSENWKNRLQERIHINKNKRGIITKTYVRTNTLPYSTNEGIIITTYKDIGMPISYNTWYQGIPLPFKCL